MILHSIHSRWDRLDWKGRLAVDHNSTREIDLYNVQKIIDTVIRPLSAVKWSTTQIHVNLKVRSTKVSGQKHPKPWTDRDPALKDEESIHHGAKKFNVSVNTWHIIEEILTQSSRLSLLSRS